MGLCLPVYAFFSFLVQLIKFKALWILGKYSITELHPSTIPLFKEREEKCPSSSPFYPSVVLPSFCWGLHLLRRAHNLTVPSRTQFPSPVQSFWTVAGYFPTHLKTLGKGLFKLSIPTTKNKAQTFPPPWIYILAPVLCLWHPAPQTCHHGGMFVPCCPLWWLQSHSVAMQMRDGLAII